MSTLLLCVASLPWLPPPLGFPLICHVKSEAFYPLLLQFRLFGQTKKDTNVEISLALPGKGLDEKRREKILSVEWVAKALNDQQLSWSGRREEKEKERGERRSIESQT